MNLEDLQAEFRKEIQSKLENSTKFVEGFLLLGNLIQTLENGDLKAYRGQRPRSFRVYLQQTDLPDPQPILPLFLNIKSSLIGFNGKAGHSFDEIGLRGATVNIYKGHGLGIVLHRTGVTL